METDKRHTLQCHLPFTIIYSLRWKLLELGWFQTRIKGQFPGALVLLHCYWKWQLQMESSCLPFLSDRFLHHFTKVNEHRRGKVVKEQSIVFYSRSSIVQDRSFSNIERKTLEKKKSPTECLDIFLDYFINPPSFIFSLIVWSTAVD